jgi:hypothetical protein
MPIQLPDDWQVCERGNTWLVSESNHVAWFDLPDGKRLEVSVTPDNYPGFYVTVLEDDKGSDAGLLAHVKKLVDDGWIVRKCNIPGFE